MGKFRKKPVVIEAIQVTQENVSALLEVADQHKQITALFQTVDGGSVTNWLAGVEIDTLEGKMTATLGDWLIRGASGEFYACKPDIFEKTYEPVEAENQ